MNTCGRNFGSFEVEEDLFALRWPVKFLEHFGSRARLADKFVAPGEKRL
jgi:hypothetical protein